MPLHRPIARMRRSCGLSPIAKLFLHTSSFSSIRGQDRKQGGNLTLSSRRQYFVPLQCIDINQRQCNSKQDLCLHAGCGVNVVVMYSVILHIKFL